MPPLCERTPLSSLTAEAKPAWIAPFGNRLELRQAAKRPFPIVRIKARSRQIIVTQSHKGPSAARLKQKFDRRLPWRNAGDATPCKNHFAAGHDLDIVAFDLHPAGFRRVPPGERCHPERDRRRRSRPAIALSPSHRLGTRRRFRGMPRYRFLGGPLDPPVSRSSHSFPSFDLFHREPQAFIFRGRLDSETYQRALFENLRRYRLLS